MTYLRISFPTAIGVKMNGLPDAHRRGSSGHGANLISRVHYGSTTSREYFRGRGCLEDAGSVYKCTLLPGVTVCRRAGRCTILRGVSQLHSHCSRTLSNIDLYVDRGLRGRGLVLK